MPVGQGREEFGEVVDQQAVDDPVPAALPAVRHGPRHLPREPGERRSVVFGEQLGALQVAQQDLPGHAVGGDPDDDVLEVRFEYDAVVEVGREHGRHQQPEIGVPPGEGLPRARVAEQPGELR